ncbi:sodium:solute symporter family protein [Salinibacterium sp. PAMC 21357]|uniref:sodium:solute symporter family protein n=1 Tax=Salinibacterium sp. PAMC 21357 TaxID=1112215 RepID=UPI000288EE79|nr:sodium:solute symporter family protein [Salinibacterium sp. PAMC 21357]
MQTTHVVILVVYIALMIAIGIWFSRSKAVSDGDDFVLAGRSLPAPVLTGTLLATFVGSGSIIGGANFVYSHGPLAGFVFFGGTFLGIICLYFLATKVRRMSHYTIPQLLEARFGKRVRVLGTVIVLVAYIGITAYQFTGAGYIFSLITPLSPVQGTIVAALLITFLAMGGGLKSVAWTDFFSAFVVAIALIASVFFVFINDVGGWGSYVNQLDPALRSITGGLTSIQMLGFFLPLFLLILGDQNMHQRLAAAKSERAARTATIGFFFGAILIIGPIILLASASSFLQPDVTADMAVISLGANGYTPAGIGGMLLAGAFALIITTGSSYLLSCSGNIVHDLVFQFKHVKVDKRRALVLGRWSVLGVAVLAYVMVQFFPSVLALQMYAYTMYGVSITPVVLAALFWKRATPAGAISGMIAGGLMTVIWQLSSMSEEINAVVVSLPVALVALIGVSLVTKNPKADTEAEPAPTVSTSA